MPIGMSNTKYFFYVGGCIVWGLIGAGTVHNYFKPNLELDLDPELLEKERKVEKFKRNNSLQFILEKTKK